MRRPTALCALPAAAVAALALAPYAGAEPPPPQKPKAPARGARPVVLGAEPVADPSDRVGDGYRRVTFSPDGDGRGDVVRIRVRVIPGDRLSLWVHPASRTPFYLPLRKARRSPATVVWDGRQADGTRYPDGSYILRVCDSTRHRCSRGRVLAHLRIMTLYARRATAVSAGQTIRVHIATDRRGPYRLDLVSAVDTGGPGLGAVWVAEPGWVSYRVPAVPHGGLWLLRVRSRRAGTQFPLVVHQPGLRLDDPPPHTALVVYPWLTWRAYDQLDGNRDGQVDSWYAHPRNPVVPLYGPFEPATSDPRFEGLEPNPLSQAAFASWMLAHKLTAQHVTDVELGRLPASVLGKYPVIVFAGHTEYYERATYEKVRRYRDAGGRLYFLQGNSFYGEAEIRGAQVIRRSYRYRSAERSDFALAVTGFRSCCWPAEIRPVYRLAPGAVESLPWAFEGTGLEDGDPFGIAAGEVDTVDPKLSPPGTVTVATATVPRFTPTRQKPSYAWIGERPIPYQPAWRRSRKIAIAYAAVGRGEVFSWANTGFMQTVRFPEYGLPASERAALDRVALNVWEHFVR